MDVDVTVAAAVSDDDLILAERGKAGNSGASRGSSGDGENTFLGHGQTT
jgi:hypothetical protein